MIAAVALLIAAPPAAAAPPAPLVVAVPATPAANHATAPAAGPVDQAGFVRLMARVADGWSRPDAALALSAFAPDAVYMEPPDAQLFVGHAQLRAYFGAVRPGTRMVWRGLWFGPAAQTGVGEFSFGRDGAADATHGVAVVALRDGRIATWREYHRRRPAEWERFIAPDGKS
jgi:ketosteroid isomerase-like protein